MGDDSLEDNATLHVLQNMRIEKILILLVLAPYEVERIIRTKYLCSNITIMTQKIVQEIQDADFVVIGSGLCAFSFAEQTTSEVKLAIISAGFISPEDTIPPELSILNDTPMEDVALAQGNGRGGMNRHWKGFLYVVAPSVEELKSWPEQTKSIYELGTEYARRLFQTHRRRSPSYQRIARQEMSLLRGHEVLTTKAPSFWGQGSKVTTDSLIEPYIVEELEKQGLSRLLRLRNLSNGEVLRVELGNDQILVLAAGGLGNFYLMKNSGLLDDDYQGELFTTHIVGRVGHFSASRGLDKKLGRGRVRNPKVIQISIGNRFHNLFFYRESELCDPWAEGFKSLIKLLVSRIMPKARQPYQVVTISECLPASGTVLESDSGSFLRVTYVPSEADIKYAKEAASATLQELRIFDENLEGVVSSAIEYQSGGHYLSATPAGASIGISGDFSVENFPKTWTVGSNCFPTGIASNPSFAAAALSAGLAQRLLSLLGKY